MKENYWSKSLLFVFIFFNFLAINTWLNIYKTNPTGDEPHYVVMASAIANYGTFEQTKAYTDEFYNKTIYLPGFSTLPPRENQSYGHAQIGSHGLFNVHNVGFPLIIAPIYKFFGIDGIKVFLILIFSTSIFLLWCFMKFFRITEMDKILIIVATLFSFPFLTAANQIYSSLLAALISLLSIIWILYRTKIKINSLKFDLIILSIIAYQPWLQIKFLAPAFIATIAIVAMNIKHQYRLKQMLILFLPIIGSIITLALYNTYAFDNPFGPYSHGSMVINKTTVMVLLGLHIDQFQGVFMQNPIMFIGLLFLVPFIKWNWKIGILTLLLYLSFIVPNAMHPNWYGGWSYAGRFAWAASLIWIVPTIFGLIQIKKLKPIIFYLTILVSIILQMYFLSKFIYADFSLYNHGTKILETVNTFYSPYQYFFPSFSNDAWAFKYQTNYAYIFLFLSLIFIGKYSQINDKKQFLKILKLYFLIALPSILAISILSSGVPPVFHGKDFLGKDLPSQTGEKAQDYIIANNETPQGFITYGPYINLPSGNYKFDITYKSSELNITQVGTWDVVIALRKESKVIDKGSIIGTDNKESHIVKTFTMPKEYSNKKIEIRNYYNGSGDLTIKSLTITRIK